jgi:hypothetical protein
MMGMEKMIASLLGITPEEMQSQVNKVSGLIETASTALVDIVEKQNDIIARLERMESAQRNDPARIGFAGSRDEPDPGNVVAG